MIICRKVSKFPSWANTRIDWEYVGWIARNPAVEFSFEQLCQNALRSDHGELRKIDHYPEGAVCWMKEQT